MRIQEQVYRQILSLISEETIETGGILGGKNNVITEFEFDKGTSLSSKKKYYPNTKRLNDCIEKWQNRDIQFYGILHSHLQEERALSFGDKLYIQTIMQAMPMSIEFLYFPIVLLQKEIVSFKAVRLDNEINIVNSDIKIINERTEIHEKS